MRRGDKSAYADKQKRKAEHIEQGYEDRGVPKKDAEARAWATVNKESGGGNKSGSGSGKPDTHVSSSRGGKARKSGSPEQRSAAARKGWVTRRKTKRLNWVGAQAHRREMPPLEPTKIGMAVIPYSGREPNVSVAALVRRKVMEPVDMQSRLRVNDVAEPLGCAGSLGRVAAAQLTSLSSTSFKIAVRLRLSAMLKAAI